MSTTDLAFSDSAIHDARACDGAMGHWPTRLLGGLPITVADRRTIAEGFINFAVAKRGRGGAPFYSTSANGQVLSMCATEDAVRQEFIKADQILADGMPMVLYSKFFGKKAVPERAATTDLFHDIARLAVERDVSFYILGADPESNDKAIHNIKQQYPNLRIVGHRHGYFDEAEEDDIIQQINAVSPDILWIGMGVPREQFFCSRNLERLDNVGVVKTSGGLFDFLSGKRSRAPAWTQALGLEWAYRALLEPKRLGKRYLQTNPHALKLLFTRS